MMDQMHIPNGALPGEKSDNIDAKLSSGEFIIPAEVVRYFGVRYFENMINEANENLGNMQENDRIQGDEGPEEESGEMGMPEFAAGGLAQTGKVKRFTTPDGRVIFRYVDAQGNPVGNQLMGNQLIGGVGRSWAAPGEVGAEKKVETKAPDTTKDTFEQTHGDGPAGPTDGGVDDGGPGGKGFASFSDFADAATEQLGNVADTFGKDVEQALGNFGRDIGIDDTDAGVDTSSSSGGFGPDSGESDSGGPPGGVDASAGEAGGPDAGESDSGEGSGMGADPDGGDAYADGGLVMPKGLDMKKNSNTGKKVPPGLHR